MRQKIKLFVCCFSVSLRWGGGNVRRVRKRERHRADIRTAAGPANLARVPQGRALRRRPSLLVADRRQDGAQQGSGQSTVPD